MAELIPYPFARLASRMFRELERDGSIFDLPASRFVRGDAGRDLSVSLHGKRAASPLGPAAGPQSQLAQNLVLSFLGGARIFELKTVQILDRLKIPRPCIDLSSVGYNVEWSQELTLEESLEEYVKGSMLIELLVASGRLGLAPGFDACLFDMSVGYDLAGVRSERVLRFMRGMMDAREVVERLRQQLPPELGQYRDLDFTTRLSNTLTLSTFHGCPPDEIERIVEFLQDELGLHCIVKLNPTLLGPTEVRRLLHDVLGYEERVPDKAFEKDTRWEQALGFIERLGARADQRGLGFGVKCTNTLIVENHRTFFPASEKEMYLSGPPLHVLAMSLVGRLRETFGDRYPISFSAGIDRDNFADAVSLGLVPVTVCTDLLRPGGYGRLHHYFGDLGKRMVGAGARDLDALQLRGQGQAEAALARALPEGPERAACTRALAEGGDLRAAAGTAWPRWLSEARLANTRVYLERVLAEPRYRRAANSKPPPKIGSRLELFDCITCDKCVPVCPNDANFTFVLPRATVPVVKLRAAPGGGFTREAAASLTLTRKHQIGNFADFCNECGNCDVFCPEDGGPYVVKPRFFGSEAAFRRFASHDGFFLLRQAGRDAVLGRFAGRELRLEVAGGAATYSGEGFTLELDPAQPDEVRGHADAGLEVDLTYFHILDWLRKALLDGPGVNYVNA
ncbi:MAG: glutamate synthase [Deltaproteobacteria bacterium]|nr:glutamate synthase [Deltaproteobacteria bacterium]